MHHVSAGDHLNPNIANKAADSPVVEFSIQSIPRYQMITKVRSWGQWRPPSAVQAGQCTRYRLAHPGRGWSRYCAWAPGSGRRVRIDYRRRRERGPRGPTPYPRGAFARGAPSPSAVEPAPAAAPDQPARTTRPASSHRGGTGWRQGSETVMAMHTGTRLDHLVQPFTWLADELR